MCKRYKTFKALPGLLADSLPDDYGNGIIDEWFAGKGFGLSDISPLDRLCYVGKRGMGALEYEPVRNDAKLDKSAKIEIEALTELAGDVLNKRKSFRNNLNNNTKQVTDILKVGTSAGGAKPKAIIAFNETTGEVRSGQVKAPENFSYWILKFDGVEDKKLGDNPLGIGRIEHAYHKMAIACGIDMTECRLLHNGKYSHFMTKRFDRHDNGNKLHVQSLCAMAHFDRDGRYSYEQMFQVMRLLNLPYHDMEQLFRRMVFNVVARNHDDHTKNHAFIMDSSGNWRLAPAYDLCYAYSPSGQWTSQHQMSVNNKRTGFVYNDLSAVAQGNGIKKYHEIIEETIGTVSRWPDFAKESAVAEHHCRQINSQLLLKLD